MKINIKVQEGYEVEDVLIKALESIRAEQEGKLRDPYLQELYNYSNTIFDVVMEAMNAEILGILQGDIIKSKPSKMLRVRRVPKDLFKHTKGEVLMPKMINGKTKVYQGSRWVSTSQALEELNTILQKEGVNNPGKAEFVRKKTGAKVDRKGLINQYHQLNSEKTLIEFIRTEYTIVDVGAKEVKAKKKRLKKPNRKTDKEKALKEAGKKGISKETLNQWKQRYIELCKEPVVRDGEKIYLRESNFYHLMKHHENLSLEFIENIKKDIKEHADVCETKDRLNSKALSYILMESRRIYPTRKDKNDGKTYVVTSYILSEEQFDRFTKRKN
ncbi:MAG: hypothetical protein GXZ11_01475 [Tissierellia bacterium]|nr:hypothetical protein [Tissierellia bacterium]